MASYDPYNGKRSNFSADSDLSDEISAALASYSDNPVETGSYGSFDPYADGSLSGEDAASDTTSVPKKRTASSASSRKQSSGISGSVPKKEPRQDSAERPVQKKQTAAEKAAAAAKPVRKKHPKLKLFVMPALLIYLDWILRLTDGLGFPGILGNLFHALAYGCFLTVFCMITKKRKVNRIITLVLMELFTIWFLIAYFCDDAYNVFMGLSSIFGEADNVVNGFGSTIVRILVRGFPIIILYHIPVILMVIFRKRFSYVNKRRLKITAVLLVLTACFGLVGYFCNNLTSSARAKYTTQYTYDTAVRRFGVLTALQLDFRYTLFGNPYDSAFTIDTSASSGTTAGSSGDTGSAPADTQTAESTGTDGNSEYSTETGTESTAAVTPKEYGYNEMILDFDYLISASTDSTIKSINEYVATLTPSKQNEYTGLCKGKNLILITAEAFSREVISEELTPMLYKMMTEGIYFEDFYQPAWGGSTSTGEYSFVTGLVPTSSSAMKNTIGKNMYFTMGNQLQRLGYYSVAYHNGEYTYYDRDKTHPNLGYSSFIGIGNGMESGVTKAWPRSDLEMMQWTVSQYIDQQPFSVYYMSISGHCNYSVAGNNMSRKNIDAVANLPYSDTVKAYLAANLELEYALEYLVEALEDAGIADDTVIALCPDHYPYGLDKDDTWGNDEDYLSELYGYNANESNMTRDHSIAIIWSACMEDWNLNLDVKTPTYSLDLLPTLSNLFGVEYDSRLLVGRDVFSDAEPLVLWNDYKWLTDKGYYNGSTFIANEGVTVDDDYVSRIKTIVSNKISFSKSVLNSDYYKFLFGTDDVK